MCRDEYGLLVSLFLSQINIYLLCVLALLCARIHARTHAHTHTHTCIHTLSLAHTNARTCVCARARALSLSLSHVHKPHMLSTERWRALSFVVLCTHTHLRTSTSSSALPLSLPLFLSPSRANTWTDAGLSDVRFADNMQHTLTTEGFVPRAQERAIDDGGVEGGNEVASAFNGGAVAEDNGGGGSENIVASTCKEGAALPLSFDDTTENAKEGGGRGHSGDSGSLEAGEMVRDESCGSGNRNDVLRHDMHDKIFKEWEERQEAEMEPLTFCPFLQIFQIFQIRIFWFVQLGSLHMHGSLLYIFFGKTSTYKQAMQVVTDIRASIYAYTFLKSSEQTGGKLCVTFC